MVNKARAMVGIVLILLGIALALPTTTAVDKAPDIELTDVDDVTFRLSDYAANDTVLVLDFMFLTCDPCKELAHGLKEMYDGDDREYEILSIDTSIDLDNSTRLKKYAEENDYHWRFAMDNDDNDAYKEYSPRFFPTVVIINTEGYVTYRASAKVTNLKVDDISKAIDKAISGEAEPIQPVEKVALVAIAFITGLAAFFSPCAFPLLPGYITYYFKVGAEAQRKREKASEVEATEGKSGPTMGRQVKTGLKLGSISGFGIVLVYFVLGIIFIPLLLFGVSSIEGAITYFKPIVGAILVVMGILTGFGIAINTGYITAPFRRLKERIKPTKGPKKPTFNTMGLFYYGVGYGSASASCTLPAFLALVFFSVRTGVILDAVVTFLVFLVSLWLLMAVVSVALTVSEERVKSGMMKYYIWIERITGVVFIIAGTYLILLFLTAEGYITF